MKHLSLFEEFEGEKGSLKLKGTNMTLSQLEDKFGKIRSYTQGPDGEIIQLADLYYPHLKMSVEKFLDKYDTDDEDEDGEEDLGNLYPDDEWEEWEEGEGE